jgi:hypothetical protein
MSPTRQTLHNLVDSVDISEINLVCQILMKFVPEVEPEQDEIDVIKEYDKEKADGALELINHKDVDWDNLSSYA